MTDPSFIPNLIKQFQYYKGLGDKTFDQVSDTDLFWQFNNESNSIAIIAKHIAGNALSRWTDFLTTDGEKEWRNREQEFEMEFTTRKEVIDYWEKGWAALFEAITPLTIDDLERIIYIRNMGHTALEAINRQLAHYAYHVGQMVYIGRMIKGAQWQSLSIPKGDSAVYNSEKFAAEKARKHFSDEFLDKP
jgi:hypothetical protein